MIDRVYENREGWRSSQDVGDAHTCNCSAICAEQETKGRAASDIERMVDSGEKGVGRGVDQCVVSRRKLDIVVGKLDDSKVSDKKVVPTRTRGRECHTGKRDSRIIESFHRMRQRPTGRARADRGASGAAAHHIDDAGVIALKNDASERSGTDIDRDITVLEIVTRRNDV